MLCNDQSVSYLKSFGYNVVRLPKADINPLQIITKNGVASEVLGDLSTILVQGGTINLPLVKRNEITAAISGQRTSDLSVGVGLSILSNIIGAMGGGKIGLDSQYNNARTIAFEFQEVLTDSVEIAALDQYLSDADINPYSTHMRKLLESDDIYIITSVIKSTTLNVEAAAKDKTAIHVDVPAIQQIVGANIKIEANASQSSKVSFSGKIPLVFGFKAVKLSYDDGKYTAFEPTRAGSHALSAEAFSAVAEPGGISWMVSDNAVLNLV